jgi:hypothetical protein
MYRVCDTIHRDTRRLANYRGPGRRPELPEPYEEI